MSVPPPRLTAARPELPDALNQVLARALAKEPDDRYDSCGTFADALREALGPGALRSLPARRGGRHAALPQCGDDAADHPAGLAPD
ncbi:MAG: hypothetical protein ACRDPF_17280 [Streptosporangiaceae bacterium]